MLARVLHSDAAEHMVDMEYEYGVDARGLGKKTFNGGTTCGKCNYWCVCGSGGNDRPFIICAGGFTKCSGIGTFNNPRHNPCTDFCNKGRQREKDKKKKKSCD